MKLFLYFINSLLILTSNLAKAENTISNDPLFTKQWALKNNGQVILRNISDLERVKVVGIPGKDINWIDTSLIPTTKKEIIVAVLDSGVDISHTDLSGRIWYNEKLCTNAPNAKILACNGFNFLDGNNNVADDIGHGTHVAGIIAANKNVQGIMGAGDPRIKIMPVKVLSSKVNGFVFNGKLITDVVADAMIFAIKNGAEVINLSLGWPKLIDTAKVRQAFQMAEEQNVIVIAASGNNSKDLPTFPCAYENVICVGASDNRGELAEFSNHGSKVDIVAPGEYIVSTIPKNLESRVLRIANYEVKRGSSQSAPFVTAAVATLKLLKPNLSNDQVRSLLFTSSDRLTNEDSRFVKFGSLNMKKLLNDILPNTFIVPLLKNITEVKFRANDQRFSFNLPVKNYSQTEFTGEVCVSFPEDAVVLDQECFVVNDLKSFAQQNLVINGYLKDLSKDSHILLNIKTSNSLFQTSIVFSRDLKNDGELKNEVVTNGKFEEMGIINGDRKVSRMVRVIDKYHRLNHPEYFFLDRTKQTATATIVSLLTFENNNYIVKDITLPLVSRVLSIHRQDIDLDGHLDLFIYALSAKKDELVFFNLKNNLTPLFGNHSKWSFPLTTFEGLPIDGGVEKFEWFKLSKSDLGPIVIPSLFRRYTMPDLDNSKDILERITTADTHQYYFNPVIQKDGTVKIDLRVIDSVSLIKKLKKELGLYEDQVLNFLKPFPQTNEESLGGIIRTWASIDDSNQRRFVEIKLNGDELKLNTIPNTLGIENALMYPLLNTENGKLQKDFIFTSLLNRATAEFLLKKDSEILLPQLLRQDFDNPIIGVIGAFETFETASYLVENRSSVTFLTADGVESHLPVYRDSSFPGQNFSETLMPILANGLPGVFVNSTLIYGERLYSMIPSNSSLIRPLKLSILIPEGCIALNPETVGDSSSYNYVFLCTDPNKQVSLKFLPML